MLSAAMANGEAIVQVKGALPAEAFYADANRRIFEAILALHADGKPADIVTVTGLLRDHGRLEQIGGTPYMAQIADATPFVAHVLEHADRVLEKWRLRQLIATAQKIAAEGYHAAGDTQVFLDQAAASFAEIAGEVRKRTAVSVGDVLDEWAACGPLVHEATGIARLDELTGGGPVYGSRWYFSGAPDAGKTALLVQLLHVYAARGVAVGLLAVDEEPSDIATRLVQRIGYSRQHCEIRDPMVLRELGAIFAELPIRLYDATWTIECAAADLAAYSKRFGGRAVLGVDSIQTVRCDAESVAAGAGRELSEVAAVTARVHAVRNVATRYGLIALATSEMGRGAYSRKRDDAEQTSTMAAGKWSGAIEYSARVLIGIRNVSGEPDLVELDIAKNKHGPRDEKFYLRIDRRSQSLAPSSFVPMPDDAADKDAAGRARVVKDAATVARLLLAKPGQGLRDIRGAAKAAENIGHDRVDAALAKLGDAVEYGTGARGAKPMTLAPDAMPEDVKLAMGVPNG